MPLKHGIAMRAYVHSFDVFILGTLMAKKHGIHNIEAVALGFLFSP